MTTRQPTRLKRTKLLQLGDKAIHILDLAATSAGWGLCGSELQLADVPIQGNIDDSHVPVTLRVFNRRVSSTPKSARVFFSRGFFFAFIMLGKLA